MKQKLHDNNFISQNSFDRCIDIFATCSFRILRSFTVEFARFTVIHHPREFSLLLDDIEILKKPRGVFAESSRSKARCNSKGEERDKRNKGLTSVALVTLVFSSSPQESSVEGSRNQSYKEKSLPSCAVNYLSAWQPVPCISVYIYAASGVRSRHFFRSCDRAQGAFLAGRDFRARCFARRFFTVNPAVSELPMPRDVSSCLRVSKIFAKQFSLEPDQVSIRMVWREKCSV